MAITKESRDKIQECIIAGEMKKAKQELNKVLKMGPFTASDKNFIASVHSCLGDLPRALKTTGKELSREDLLNCSKDELALQYKMAFVIHEMGARHTGNRIRNKVETVLNEKNYNLYTYDSTLTFMIGHSFRTENKFIKSIKACDEILNLIKERKPEDIRNIITIKVIQADGHRLLGNQKECDDVLKEVNELLQDQEYLKTDLSNYSLAIYNRCVGQTLMHRHQMDEAFPYLEKALEHRGESTPSIVSCVIKILMGHCFSIKGEKKKAVKFFEDALNHLLGSRAKPGSVKECYLMLERLRESGISFEQSLGLRCHHLETIASYAAGRKCPEGFEPERFPMLAGSSLNYDKDVWVIDNKTVQPAHYAEAIQWKNYSTDSVLDLKSGIIFSRDSDFKIIPEMQLRCLAPILGAGEIGINKWSLIDLMYSGEEFCFSYGEERLKYIVGQLKKNGFNILRKKNYYFFDHKNNADMAIIFPMDNPEQRLYEFLKVQVGESFLSEDIVNLFKVHKATAWRWIAAWEENGIIYKNNGKLFFKNAKETA